MASQIVKLFLRVRENKDPLAYSIHHKTFEFSSSSYEFHRIFNKDNNEQDLFEEIGKPLVENIMRGVNGILLAYGASGSGKSFSLLGDNGKEGIVIRVLEDIFTRVKVLKAKQKFAIVISYFEIEGSRIKDLARGLNDEILDIREYQGNVYIDNLTVTQIETLAEAIRMIREGRSAQRQQVHLAVKITVSQKEMNLNKAGTLFLIELADSDAGCSDVDLTLKSLKNLIVDLQQGHYASSDESTFTKILATNLKHHCLTSVIFHINPSEKQQTLNTLQYSNNCYSHTNSTAAESAYFKSQQQSNRIRKLQEEILDLKYQIDKCQEIHEGKLRGFGEIIGFNVDLEAALSSDSGGKERKIIETHINSIEVLGELEFRNRKLEEKLNKNSKMFEDLQKFEAKNKERNAAQVKSLEDEIKGLKLDIIELKIKLEDEGLKKSTWKKQEIQEVLLEKHAEIEEKAAAIHNLPFTLQSVASDLRLANDHRERARAEAEKDLNQKFNENEENHRSCIKAINQETESSLKQIEAESRRFQLECSMYIREKMQQISKIEEESIACFEIVTEQDKLIRDIELGAFNKGIPPVKISQQHIPKPPQREKYPYLFQILTKHGKLTSRKDNEFIKIFRNKYTTDNKTTLQNSKSLFVLKFPATQRPEATKESSKTSELHLTEKTMMLRYQATELQKELAESHKFLKNSRQNLKELEKQDAELVSETEKIVKEKEKQREMYGTLIKNKTDTKIVISSQKRLLDKYTFITEAKSRPSTGTHRPQTASAVKLSLVKSQLK